MSVTTETVDDDIQVVWFVDRIDSNNADEAEAAVRALLDEGYLRLLFDLSELAYISSAGLRVVLMTAKMLGRSGGRLALCRLNDNVRQVFEVSGFLPMLQVYKEREGALEYLQD
jgi:anti-anti-sigma factor